MSELYFGGSPQWVGFTVSCQQYANPEIMKIP